MTKTIIETKSIFFTTQIYLTIRQEFQKQQPDDRKYYLSVEPHAYHGPLQVGCGGGGEVGLDIISEGKGKCRTQMVRTKYTSTKHWELWAIFV